MAEQRVRAIGHVPQFAGNPADQACFRSPASTLRHKFDTASTVHLGRPNIIIAALTLSYTWAGLASVFLNRSMRPQVHLQAQWWPKQAHHAQNTDATFCTRAGMGPTSTDHTPYERQHSLPMPGYQGHILDRFGVLTPSGLRVPAGIAVWPRVRTIISQWYSCPNRAAAYAGI